MRTFAVGLAAVCAACGSSARTGASAGAGGSAAWEAASQAASSTSTAATGGAGGGACMTPAPTIASLNPTALLTSSSPEALVVTGSGFSAATTATFDNVPVTVKLGSPTQLTLTIPPAQLAAIGMGTVTVTNPGCGSASADVPVRAPSSLAAGGWPRHHHDNQNTSATSSVVAPSPKLLWKAFTAQPASGVSSEGGGFWSSPVVAPGMGEFPVERVFVGAPDGTIFAFEADGTLGFHFTGVGASPYGVDSAGAVRADGTFYIGVSDANLYAINPDGSKLWSYTTGDTSDASSAVAEDGTILYASDDGSVYALTSAGKVKWSSAIGEVDSAIATSKQALGDDKSLARVYVGSGNGWFCLSGVDGKTVWSVPSTGGRGATVSSPVVGPGGEVYGVDSGGQAVKIDKDGNVVWSVALPGGPGTSPALAGDHLYVVAADGVLRALATADGKTLWSHDVHGTTPDGGEAPVPAVDGNGEVFVFSPDGKLYRFAGDGTTRPAIAVSPPLAEFLVPQVAIGASGTVYVSGTDGTLYAYQ